MLRHNSFVAALYNPWNWAEGDFQKQIDPLSKNEFLEPVSTKGFYPGRIFSSWAINGGRSSSIVFHNIPIGHDPACAARG
jgi:hypothetical protein